MYLFESLLHNIIPSPNLFHSCEMLSFCIPLMTLVFRTDSKYGEKYRFFYTNFNFIDIK